MQTGATNKARRQGGKRPRCRHLVRSCCANSRAQRELLARPQQGCRYPHSELPGASHRALCQVLLALVTMVFWPTAGMQRARLERGANASTPGFKNHYNKIRLKIINETQDTMPALDLGTAAATTQRPVAVALAGALCWRVT